MKRRLKFTIYHGFAASLVLHSVLGLPLVAAGWALPPEEPSMLVIDLQGVVAESQVEQKFQQETKAEAKQDETKTAKAAPRAAGSEPQPTQVAADEKASTPPEPTPIPSPSAAAKSGAAGSNSVLGAEEPQQAQTIKPDPDELDRLKDYVRLLTKKVQTNLLYPDDGRRAGLQGTATVSFAILSNGQIRPETLMIVESSGQPKLDASALRTIRASLPFAPPPKEMTVAIEVAFGRKP